MFKGYVHNASTQVSSLTQQTQYYTTSDTTEENILKRHKSQQEILPATYYIQGSQKVKAEMNKLRVWRRKTPDSEKLNLRKQPQSNLKKLKENLEKKLKKEENKAKIIETAPLTGNTYLPGTFYKGIKADLQRNKPVKRRMLGRGQEIRRGKGEIGGLRKQSVGRLKSSSSTSSLRRV